MNIKIGLIFFCQFIYWIKAIVVDYTIFETDRQEIANKFRKLLNLRSLKILKSKLDHLDENIFNNINGKLEYLDLDDSGITTIKSNTFSNSFGHILRI